MTNSCVAVRKSRAGLLASSQENAAAAISFHGNSFLRCLYCAQSPCMFGTIGLSIFAQKTWNLPQQASKLGKLGRIGLPAECLHAHFHGSPRRMGNDGCGRRGGAPQGPRGPGPLWCQVPELLV